MPGIVSNPEILVSGLQCTVRSGKTVIAIVPQIGTGNTTVSASSLQPKGAGNPANPPFSSVLEQANPSTSESQSGTDQGVGEGSGSRGAGLAKREAKASDSKSNEPQKGGNATTETPAPSLDAQVRTVPVVIVQPQLSPILLFNAEMKDFISKAAASTDRSGASSATAGHPTALTTLSKDPTLAKLQGGTSSQDSASTASAQSTNADAIQAEAVQVGAIKAEAVAGQMTKLAGTATSDSKTQTANASLPARTTARGTAEGTDGVHPPQAAVKSAIEQSLVPPSVAGPGQDSPAPGKLESGSSQGTRTKPVLDKSRVGVTQESSGANRKGVDVTGSAKAQSRKDETPSSGGSTGDGQATSTTPAKPLASTTAFSAAGIQPSANASDPKGVSAGVSHEGNDRQPGQLAQKSPSVVQFQAPGESSSPYSTSIVHSAKLVERIGETELRLGIRAGEFGSVDVRTSMVRNQFTAEISTERGELGRALAAELPSLQNRLTDQRVPVATITVQNHTGGQSASSEQQTPRHGQQGYSTNPGSGREEGLVPAFVALEATAEASRLDIRM